MFLLLIIVPIVLIIFLLFVTIYILKNVKKKEDMVEELYIKKENWNHIRDYEEINSQSENKANIFENGLEEEERTVGVEFFENFKDNNDDINNMGEELKKDDNYAHKEKNNFINDFATMSIDEYRNIDAQNSQETDETIDMFSNLSSNKNVYPIEVILRYKEGNYNKLIKMETEQITIGRNIGNDLVFKGHNFVGRNHAILYIRGGRLYLRDLNSKNGTYINNSKDRIQGEVLIERSCDITFGDAVMNVSVMYR